MFCILRIISQMFFPLLHIMGLLCLCVCAWLLKFSWGRMLLLGLLYVRTEWEWERKVYIRKFWIHFPCQHYTLLTTLVLYKNNMGGETWVNIAIMHIPLSYFGVAFGAEWMENPKVFLPKKSCILKWFSFVTWNDKKLVSFYITRSFSKSNALSFPIIHLFLLFVCVLLLSGPEASK